MITLMFKELNIITDVLRHFNFSVNNHSHDTRENVMLNIPFCRLSKSKFAVTVSGPKLYNSIHLDICNLTSLNPFKKQVKKHFIRDYLIVTIYVMLRFH